MLSEKKIPPNYILYGFIYTKYFGVTKMVVMENRLVVARG